MSTNPMPDPMPQVQSEVQAGDAHLLAAAARRLPGTRGGRPLAPTTVWRWTVKGAMSADGRRVRLEACRVGGRWFTSTAAVARFIAALSADAPVPVPAVAPPAARRRAADRAAEELERMGA